MSFERPRRDDKGPRVNEMIRDYEVRLIDDIGKMHGVTNTREAIAMARERGLDLVEVDPNSKPPVCKIIDYGKYKYEQKKKMQEAKKKQIVVDIKEVQFRPNIDKHDFDFKLKHIENFLNDGDKVKICIVFRGREMAHMSLGENLLKRIKEAVAPYSIIESDAKLEGKRIFMHLAPAKKIGA